MPMKSSIRAFPAVTLLAGLAQPAAAEPSYSWTLTTFVPANNQVFEDFVQTFIERVAEITDGEVEIEAFGAGVLAGPFEGYRAVQQGIADLAFMYPPFITNDDPANAVIGGMPGGMSAQGMLNWLFEGGGEELWVDFRRETMGLQPIVAGAVPTEVFLHSHKPILSLADFEGMSIRTAGAWAQIIGDFGAAPTVLAPAEIFTMLERRGVDAIEFVTPAINQSAGYDKVAPYIIVPGVHQPSGAYEVVIRAEVWDALPDPLKSKLRAAGRLATFDSLMKTEHQDLAAFGAFEAGNNELQVLPPDVLAEMVAASHAWAGIAAGLQTDKGNPWMERIYGSYAAYQKAWNAGSVYRWKDGMAD